MHRNAITSHAIVHAKVSCFPNCVYGPRIKRKYAKKTINHAQYSQGRVYIGLTIEKFAVTSLCAHVKWGELKTDLSEAELLYYIFTSLGSQVHNMTMAGAAFYYLIV